MSLAAILWAIRDAPVINAQEHVILIAMADPAHEDGTACFLAAATIALRARCSTRTAHRHLQALEERGLITRGDQQLVAHYRADRRPVVWNLMLDVRGDKLSPRADGDTSGTRGDTGDTSCSVHGVTNGAPRGDNRGSHGVTPVSYKARTKPTTESKEGWEPPDVVSPHVRETLPAAFPAHCSDHASIAEPPPCRACALARTAHAQAQIDHNAAAASRRRIERERIAEAARIEISACSMCDDAGYYGTTVCSHDPLLVGRMQAGLAKVRQAIAPKPVGDVM